MTEYYIHMDVEGTLPSFFPRFVYYCAFINEEKNEEDLE